MLVKLPTVLLVAGLSCFQTMVAAETIGIEFKNTVGLIVATPYDGMTVRTNSSLSISASLQNGANIGTALITVAKADGSANETIADIKGNATPRVTQSWSISALQYPEGKYIVQLIVTPAGATAPAPSNGTAQTTQVAPPSATGGSATGPSIYYWRGTVKVTSPDKPDGTKTAAASSHVIGSALSKAAVAMGALVLASLVSA